MQHSGSNVSGWSELPVLLRNQQMLQDFGVEMLLKHTLGSLYAAPPPKVDAATCCDNVPDALKGIPGSRDDRDRNRPLCLQTA